MKIKVTIQHENLVDEEPIHWDIMHEVTSEDRFVIAWTLRAVANQYDPPPAAADDTIQHHKM